MKRALSVLLCFVFLLFSCVYISLFNVREEKEFYLYDGYIVKRESEFNVLMGDYAIKLFNRIYDEQLQNSGDVYFALIPDKHRIISGMDDYDSFLSYMKNGMSFAQTIEIDKLITLSDYYRTDPHLKQECVVDAANRLCEEMGTEIERDFEKVSFSEPFFGTYSEQSKLDTEGDTLTYLTNDSIENAKVIGANDMYDTNKFYSDDPYEVFLSGNQSVVTIRNSKAENSKRLVIFRDSFASSLAPVISTAYSEVVLIDIRYIMSESLNEYVDFENADVLFLYSTLLLNNSMSMK